MTEEYNNYGSEWYDNKALFEMLQSLETDMARLSEQMSVTTTMLRDYNNLRGKVEETSARVSTLMWLTPVAIAVIGVLFTALSFLIK